MELMFFAGVVLWIASVSIVLDDCRQKRLDPIGWGVLTLLLPGLGLIIYAVFASSKRVWGAALIVVSFCIGLGFFSAGYQSQAAETQKVNKNVLPPIVKLDPSMIKPYAQPVIVPTPEEILRPGEQTFKGGPMNPVGGSNVAGVIDVKPTHGVRGTRVRITVRFTSGAEQVSSIKVYSFSEYTAWSRPLTEIAYIPHKSSSNTWTQSDLAYTNSKAYVFRFYAYTKDGRVVSVGDIAKNGGGPAVGAGNDGIGEYAPYYRSDKLTI